MASAARGLAGAVHTERHLRVHLVLAAAVLIAGAWVPVSLTGLAVLALAVGLVLAAELANTAVERLTDLMHPDPGPGARDVKDVAAATVLVASALALCAGVLVLGPGVGLSAGALRRGVPLVVAAGCLVALAAGAARRRR